MKKGDKLLCLLAYSVHRFLRKYKPIVIDGAIVSLVEAFSRVLL